MGGVSSTWVDDVVDDEQGGNILSEPVSLLDPRKPASVGRGASLAAAFDLMNDVGVGAVLVQDDDGHLAGILTERDLLRKAFGKMDLDTRVEAVMTPKPEVIRMETPILRALEMMHFGRYRHLPIVDPAGHAVAIVSIRDVIAFLVEVAPRSLRGTTPRPNG